MAKKPLTNGSTGVEQLASADALAVVGGLAVGQSGDPETTAIFEVDSTTKGALLPRMTTAQRDAISSPAADLFITNTETDGLDMYNGSRWFRFTQSAGLPTFTIGSGWGTGATSSIEGTDLAGKITVTSGTGSLTPTTWGTVTFNKAFPTGAKYAVVFSPANDNARSLALSAWTYAASIGIGSFIADCNSSNITSRVQNSLAYQFFYKVVQYE